MHFNFRKVSRNPYLDYLLVLSVLLAPGLAWAGEQSIGERVDALVKPVADVLSSIVFFKVSLLGAELPLIVVWLVIAAVFFTVYFRFLNLTGFAHAFRLIKGDFAKDGHKGEVSHFQALTTAVSGTVGIGNIGGGSITGTDNGVVNNVYSDFTGDIAIVRYYDRVLSAAEVQQNYNALIPEPSSLMLALLGTFAIVMRRRR